MLILVPLGRSRVAPLEVGLAQIIGPQPSLFDTVLLHLLTTLVKAADCPCFGQTPAVWRQPSLILKAVVTKELSSFQPCILQLSPL